MSVVERAIDKLRRAEPVTPPQTAIGALVHSEPVNATGPRIAVNRQSLREAGYMPEEQQDRRFAEAARDASVRHGKPVLSATELVHTDRDYGNSGPLAVKEFGRVCYPSAHRAVEALRILVDRAQFLARR